MRWLVLAVLPLVIACDREPDFDERFDKAHKQIVDTAKEIDAELDQRSQQPAEAGAQSGAPAVDASSVPGTT